MRCYFVLLLFVCSSIGAGPFLYTQLVDHFNGSSNATFQQRYFTHQCGTLSPKSPVFLYISGEAALGGIPNDWVTNGYCEEFDAMLVTLEHRYYGSSLPMGSSAPFTVQNLKLLSVEQALADLARFVSWFAQGRPVVTFGCSYAGAMSAWFRVRYPNVTIGAISSSGVVNPILDFHQFDTQISTSLKSVDKQCLDLLHEANRFIEALVVADPKKALSMFNTTGFHVLDFLYYIADAAAETVQYGYQDTLCHYLKGSNGNIVERYASFVNEFYANVFLGGDVISYSRYHVQLPRQSGTRAWWWQTCYELAYFQTAPAVTPIRSRRLDLKYFQDFCGYVFQGLAWPPATTRISNLYGGAKPDGTELFFFQSSQDPWQWAGVMHPLGPLRDEYTVVCADCGHCSDTRGCPSLPPLPTNSTQGGCANMNNVLTARTKAKQKIAQWLGK